MYKCVMATLLLLLLKMSKISIFATFGGHFGFSRKMKSVNISKTIRDRAISSKFLTHRVVQESPDQWGKFQFSPLSAAILDFCGK